MARSPSSGASRHLLPPGEKGVGDARDRTEDHDVAEGAERAQGPASPTGSPSPLVGEGARRAGEGAGAKRPQKKSPQELASHAKAMRHAPTGAEARMWRLLRDRRFAGHKFRRQVPIGPYIADFVCYEKKLIVELDGSQHAENPRDKRRDAELERRGFRVLRVWNNDLNARKDAVMDVVWHRLEEEPTQ